MKGKGEKFIMVRAKVANNPQSPPSKTPEELKFQREEYEAKQEKEKLKLLLECIEHKK